MGSLNGLEKMIWSTHEYAVTLRKKWSKNGATPGAVSCSVT